MNIRSRVHLELRGAPPPGVDLAAQQALDETLQEIHRLFQEERSDEPAILRRQRAWTRSHLRTEHIREAVELAEKTREWARAVVTIGVGGSDLSARVFHDALSPAYANLFPPAEGGTPPLAFFTGDTFDPFRLSGLMELLSSRKLLPHTAFNVISKSGNTGETMASLLVIRDALHREMGDSSWRRQVVATTGMAESSLLFRAFGSPRGRPGPFAGGAVL